MNKSIEAKIKKEIKTVALITTKAEKTAFIKTDADVVKATEILVNVKKQLKAYEKERLEYTTPINLTLSKLNARFKDLTVPLKNAEKILKNAIIAYRVIQEEKRVKQEEKLQEKNGNSNIVVEKTLPNIVESKSGETRVSKRWTFEIEDEKKIPRCYLILDEIKVNDAILREEVRKIPGLKIFQKENISVY